MQSGSGSYTVTNIASLGTGAVSVGAFQGNAVVSFSDGSAAMYDSAGQELSTETLYGPVARFVSFGDVTLAVDDSGIVYPIAATDDWGLDRLHTTMGPAIGVTSGDWNGDSLPDLVFLDADALYVAISNP